MDNRQILEEVNHSLSKVLTLLGGASLEMHKLRLHQAKVAADLLRLCADRIDSIVDRELDHD